MKPVVKIWAVWGFFSDKQGKNFSMEEVSSDSKGSFVSPDVIVEFVLEMVPSEPGLKSHWVR